MVTQVLTKGASVPKKRKPDQAHESPRELQSTTRLPAELLRKANMVVLARNRGRDPGQTPAFTLYDYLVGILTPIVEADYSTEIEEEFRHSQKPGKKS